MMESRDYFQTPNANFRALQQRISVALGRITNLQSRDKAVTTEGLTDAALKSLFETLPAEEYQSKYISDMLDAMLAEKGEIGDEDNIISNPYIKWIRDKVREVRLVLNRLLNPLSGSNATKEIIAQDSVLKRHAVHTYKRFIDFCTGIDQAVSERLGQWLNQSPVVAEAATEVE